MNGDFVGIEALKRFYLEKGRKKREGLYNSIKTKGYIEGSQRVGSVTP